MRGRTRRGRADEAQFLSPFATGRLPDTLSVSSVPPIGRGRRTVFTSGCSVGIIENREAEQDAVA